MNCVNKKNCRSEKSQGHRGHRKVKCEIGQKLVMIICIHVKFNVHSSYVKQDIVLKSGGQTRLVTTIGIRQNFGWGLKRGQHIKLWANTKKASPPPPPKARQMIKMKVTARLPVLKLWQPRFRHLVQIWTWALRHNWGSRLSMKISPLNFFSNSKAVRNVFVAEVLGDWYRSYR